MKAFIIGAGTMGAGIAQVFATGGWDTVICDITDELASGGKKKIEKSLSKLIAKGKITEDSQTEMLGRICTTCDQKLVADCDIAVEAVAETMKVKKDIFSNLDSICRPDAILASNTSSLSITEIATATKNPERVIGMHFFNPAPVMKLVEVIDGVDTSTEVSEKVFNMAKSLGKEPVKVAEAPGFIVNRILIPMINEAVVILSENVASAEDIDKAMMLGANHPMGPLALSDLIGNDVTLAIMDTLYKETGDSKYRACTLLRKMVRAKKLGRKTGKGFFNY